MKNKKEEQTIKLATIEEVESSVIQDWEPTFILQWRYFDIGNGNEEKMLCQLWRSDTGEKQWRIVPEESKIKKYEK